MVKTRNQLKQQFAKPNSQQKTKVFLSKKRKEIKKPIINKDILRQKAIEKIGRQHRKNSPKFKVIDIVSDQFLQIVRPQKFNCPICLQLMIFPVMTNCGHAFCLPCLEESLKHKSSCCLCRQQINYDSFVESSLIQEIITKITQKLLKEQQRSQYHLRVKNFRQKDEGRKISQDIEEGDFIDFFGNRVWNEGKVVAIERDEKYINIKVESTGRNAITRTILFGSRQLAKHRYFTRENTMFRDFMGQFRLQISGFQGIPLFENIFNVEINPINIRQEIFEDGQSELIRFSFSIQQN